MARSASARVAQFTSPGNVWASARIGTGKIDNISSGLAREHPGNNPRGKIIAPRPRDPQFPNFRICGKNKIHCHRKARCASHSTTRFWRRAGLCPHASHWDIALWPCARPPYSFPDPGHRNRPMCLRPSSHRLFKIFLIADEHLHVRDALCNGLPCFFRTPQVGSEIEIKTRGHAGIARPLATLLRWSLPRLWTRRV